MTAIDVVAAELRKTLTSTAGLRCDAAFIVAALKIAGYIADPEERAKREAARVHMYDTLSKLSRVEFVSMGCGRVGEVPLYSAEDANEMATRTLREVHALLPAKFPLTEKETK